jgi:hypothetical protein
MVFAPFLRQKNSGEKEVVRLARIERATTGLEGRCSIQLSYRRSRSEVSASQP